MGPCRAVLLLLLLGLTRATTPRPGESTPKMTASVPPTASPRWALSYGDAVAAAVELLNARAVAPYVLRLRDALSRPGWVSAELLRHGRCAGSGRCRIRALGAESHPVSGLNPARLGAESHPISGLNPARLGAESHPISRLNPTLLGADSLPISGLNPPILGAESHPISRLNPTLLGAESHPILGLNPPRFGAESHPVFQAKSNPFGG